MFKIVHFQDCLTFEYCKIGSKTLWFVFECEAKKNLKSSQRLGFWEISSKRCTFQSNSPPRNSLTTYSSHCVEFAEFTLLSHKNVFRQINYLVTYLYLVKQLFSRNFCNYHTLCFHHFFTKISWNQCIQYHSGKKAPKISLIWRKNDWFFRRNRDRVF